VLYEPDKRFEEEWRCSGDESECTHRMRTWDSQQELRPVELTAGGKDKMAFTFNGTFLPVSGSPYRDIVCVFA
jgi:hypothetical protein